MKYFKIYLSFLAVFALLFTSCSEEEQGVTPDAEKATLSFGAIVQDLANKSTNKQSAVGDMPDCTDGTPAYVELILMQGDQAVVGSSMAPYRVDLVAGQIFTEEDAALELTPGNYSLEHFSVYDADGDLLWLAPRGGALAEFVDNPLPLSIDLGAGVKKYVDVSVICYDDRDVNLYGYQFFELDIYEAFEYCIFANYCDEDGRHYTARYSVDVAVDGTTIYSDVVNRTGVDENDDFTAEPLCGALPDLERFADDEDYITVTVTLLDWEDNYGQVESNVQTLHLSRNDIRENFNGSDGVFYEHLRFGCGDDDGDNGGETPVDSDNDGLVDSEDGCPEVPGPVDNNGCPDDGDGNGHVDSDNDGVEDEIDECEDTPQGATVNAVGCPVDSDGDGIFDGIDVCPNVNPEVDENNDGCEDETSNVGCTNLPDACTIDTSAVLDTNCYYASLGSENEWMEVNSDTELELLGGLMGDEVFGEVGISLTGGEVTVTLDGGAEQDRITSFAIEVRPNEDDLRSETCWESTCLTTVPEVDQLDPIENTFDEFDYSYPIFIKVDIVSCGTPVGTPE